MKWNKNDCIQIIYVYPFGQIENNELGDEIE